MCRTDVECKWKKRSYSSLAQDTNEEDRAWLYIQLKNYGKFTGLFWLSTEPEAAVPLPIKSVEELIYSEESLLKNTL